MKRDSNSILKDKESLLETADSIFYDDLNSTARWILRRIFSWMRNITQKNGRFAPEETDNQILLQFTKMLIRAFMDSTMGNKLDRFLRNFEKLEALNAEYYEVAMDLEVKNLGLNVERKLLIEEIVQGMDADKGIRTNIVNPLRVIVVRNIMNGSNIKESEDYLRTWILGKQDADGRLLRYVKQLTMDAINQYDGIIQKKIIEKYEMPKFRYIGSIIATSRQNCKELVYGKGRFANLRQKDGTYLVKDIPEIVKLAEGRNGWNPATNSETFLMYRGGYNCRHNIVASL